MEQLAFIDMTPPYKYIIDSSSIISQKDDEPHRKILYPTKWKNIETLINKKQIVTSTEVIDEILDIEIINWINLLNFEILTISEKTQENVKKVLSECPQLVSFKQNKSSADAFIIAIAMEYKLTVITEENKKKPYKIPKVCERLGVKCINIIELCEENNWKF